MVIGDENDRDVVQQGDQDDHDRGQDGHVVQYRGHDHNEHNGEGGHPAVIVLTAARSR